VARRLAAALLAAGLAAPGQPARAAAEEVGGAVEGVVTFAGPAPRLEPIPIDPRHREHCGPEVPSQSLVVDPATRGVRDAVVYLEAVGEARPAAKAAPRALDNRRCLFEPHVVSATVGDTLRVRNADPALHNIRVRPLGETRTLINVVQPTQGQETDREVRRAGVMTVTCDTHPNMYGWLLAFDHPYHAVTDAAGRFRLSGVPPGRYRVVAWHEGWNLQGLDRGRPVYDEPRLLAREVEVAANGTARVSFELPPK
jgi:plastocyanin